MGSGEKTYPVLEMPGLQAEVHEPAAHAFIPVENGPGKGDVGANAAGEWL
jgi:hypothetical protein